MDTKALAKSKRAHSQHHNQKHHPNRTLKSPSVGSHRTSSGNKPSGKQPREIPHQSQSSRALPSNWDRYEEEYDSGSEGPSRNITNQATDVVVPKSKGADYGHLISEAKSQSQSNISLESFPSFDDVLADFNQGVGSLLSARGEGILSWMENDNFVVDDRATANHEASFLSLNLHLLAEQLSKMDLSERLFLEPDFLPPELCSEKFGSFSWKSDQLEAACENEGMKKNSDELVVGRPYERENVESQVGQFVSIISSGSSPLSNDSNLELKSTNQVKDEPSHLGGTDESPVQYGGTTVADNKPKFVAASAEAELDRLLDSFSGTSFLDSSGVTKKSSKKLLVQQEDTSSRLEGRDDQKTFLDISERSFGATHFDNALDDLLKDTSFSAAFPGRPAETSTSALGGITSVQSAGAQHSIKGPDLSKSGLATANFDDELDDLLNETLNPGNRKGTSWSHEATAAHLNTVSSSSTGLISKSKVLDDFDSWFDTV